MKRYPLAKPYIKGKEKQYVREVLNSGVLSMGEKQRQFEQKFASFVGTRYACAVSSGTAGLHLALLAANINKEDEIITTPFSFIASANVILYAEAKPVFVDVDPITYNMDPLRIETAITKRTKAILIVHIFGQPADMTAIMKIAQKHRLKVIEDACESVGALHGGKPAGTFGESAVFAFYPNKQMTTGEGGMLVTNNKKIYDYCDSLRNQGRAPNMQWLDHKYLGYNYRMDEMSAAVGLAQIEKLDDMIKKRKTIANWYEKYLSQHKDLIQIPITGPNNTHTWFVYTVLIPKKASRNNVIKKLNTRGIASKPYLPSIHLFDFYKKTFGHKKGDFPISEDISDRSVALPFYIGLTEDDVKYIVKTLVSVI